MSRLPVLAMLATFAPLPLAGQTWKMFQFSGTERFEYEITRTSSQGTETGTFSLQMNNAGGQAMASVQASLGDGSCSATVPVANQQAAMPQLMMQCMVIAPVAMTMFAPTWAMFLTQNWTVGTSMNMNSGGDSFSFEITETCRYAGQEGVLGQIRANELEIDACVNPELPLPLAVSMNNTADGEVVRAVLTTYQP